MLAQSGTSAKVRTEDKENSLYFGWKKIHRLFLPRKHITQNVLIHIYISRMALEFFLVENCLLIIYIRICTEIPTKKIVFKFSHFPI